MRLLRLVCLLGAALAAALATSACGIKGPLTMPDGSPAPNNSGNRPGAPAR
jgi:predicted small lipoprotein YifL